MHGENSKENVIKKNLVKKMITLFSLEYSISLGEDLLTLRFPILAYPFFIFWPNYALLQISLGSFDR
jgi:hypothetical protein